MKFLAWASLILICSPSYVIGKESTPEWDLLIFTQSWPLTVCREWKEKDQAHSCQLPDKVDVWTIHGIWPTKMGTIGPQFCNKTWHFNPDEIKPIENDLEQLWTNVDKGTSLYSFWSHEWLKHGTCAAAIEQLNSEMKYFNQGLEWMQNVTMTKILEESGISPSNNKAYSIADINAAIKQELGTNPVIRCHNEKGKEYIAELRICFDKSLQLENCDGVVESNEVRRVDGNTILTNCDIDTGVIYSKDMNFKKFSEADMNRAHFYVELYNLLAWLQWLTF